MATPRKTLSKAPASSVEDPMDSAAVDARYGLEPVLEPQGDAELEAFLDVHCPHCFETYGLAVDLSGGGATFIEDCTVCCKPIACTVEVDGDHVELRTARPG